VILRKSSENRSALDPVEKILRKPSMTLRKPSETYRKPSVTMRNLQNTTWDPVE
jgi:hypothetical protein